jgi:basic amino acid/polyamine antiporter, APA family
MTDPRRAHAASDPATRPALVRAIGRWALTAAVVNSVIGSGIFGLPSTVAGFVGPWGPLAVLLAGVCMFVVVLCFAEVGSRFDQGGGPYLYAREAFGPSLGFHVGWLHVWTRLLSAAAVLNVFVAYLAVLMPVVGTPVGRALAMVIGVVLVTVLNVRGVRQSTWAVNGFTVAKLLPLVLLVLVGLVHLSPEVLATQAVARPAWTDAVLILVFAYGGFESAVIAAGEMRDPKRDMAFALIAAMVAITVLYCLVQLVVGGVLPDAARSTTPVASALAQLLGRTGATIGALAVVVSVYGWLTGFALMTPRVLLAMAERHELPAIVGRIHPVGRTPHVAIIANSTIALGLGLVGSFAETATLAAIVRLGIYASTCAALIALRRRSPSPARFTLPGGELFAVAGLGFCAWMLATRSFEQAWMLAAMVASGALARVAVRRGRAI